MSADQITSSASARPRTPTPGRSRRRGDPGGRAENQAAGATPTLREVEAVLPVALAEADRLEELEEAVEAFRRGGVEGLYADQGRTVADRVLAMVRQVRESGLIPADPELAPAPDLPREEPT